jgi:hypothetical protein
VFLRSHSDAGGLQTPIVGRPSARLARDTITRVLGLASLAVSVVALILAAGSVYVVSLRHANVVVDVTSAHLLHSAAAGAIPNTAALTVTLLLSNDGARAALIESVQVSRALETDVDLFGPLVAVITPRPFPVVIQANEAHSLDWAFSASLEGTHPFSAAIGGDDVGEAALEEIVSKVERLGEISFLVDWLYHRSTGLPFSAAWLPHWLRTGRRRVTGQLRRRLDPAEYRTSLAVWWRTVNRPELAKRVEP